MFIPCKWYDFTTVKKIIASMFVTSNLDCRKAGADYEKREKLKRTKFLKVGMKDEN